MLLLVFIILIVICSLLNRQAKNSERTQKLDGAFKKLSLQLIPSAERQSREKTAARQVFECFHQKSQYPIDRCCVSGSFGIKTGSSDSVDLDLLIFVNVEPSVEVISHFHSILDHEEAIRIVDRTNGFIKVTVDEIEIDVIPIPICPDRKIPERNPPVKIGAWEILRGCFYDILHDPIESNCDVYKDELSKLTLEEITSQQSSFVRDVVRVAQFWNQNITLSGHLCGRSTVINLIAINAGRNEEKYGSRSVSKGFERFLKLIEKIDQLEFIYDANLHFPIRIQRIQKVDLKRPVTSSPFGKMTQWQENKFKKMAEETLTKLLDTSMTRQSIRNIFPEPERYHCTIS